MPFLYHRRPPQLRGNVLYPLNLLKETHPDLYEEERRKYVGREALLELRIPIFDVLWNDALHLSPFHPNHLAAAWRAAGLAPSAWAQEFFEIPVERLAGHDCVWFASGALPGDSPLSLPVEEVSRFDSTVYEELVQPPPSYHEYLRSRLAADRPARPFAYLPHVLVAGSLDVSGLSLTRADVAPEA